MSQIYTFSDNLDNKKIIFIKFLWVGGGIFELVYPLVGILKWIGAVYRKNKGKNKILFTFTYVPFKKLKPKFLKNVLFQKYYFKLKINKFYSSSVELISLYFNGFLADLVLKFKIVSIGFALLLCLVEIWDFLLE